MPLDFPHELGRCGSALRPTILDYDRFENLSERVDHAVECLDGLVIIWTIAGLNRRSHLRLIHEGIKIVDVSGSSQIRALISGCRVYRDEEPAHLHAVELALPVFFKGLTGRTR